MKMKKNLSSISIGFASAASLAALLLAAGCGQHAASLTADQSKAFDSAPADVKQTWEKALAADKANNYETAATALDNLQKMILSAPQSEALTVERTAFGERLMKAVENNDAAAIKAMQSSSNKRTR